MKHLFYLSTFFLLFFVLASCNRNNEIIDELPANATNLQILVETSDFKDAERANTSATDEESAIKNISIFLFYPDGQELVQPNRQQTIDNGKISLTVPKEAIEGGLSAYLIANESFESTAPTTEEALLASKTTRNPNEFSAKGFPMSSKKVEIKSSLPAYSTTAVLERTPSALYIQVESPSDLPEVKNNSYKVEVEGLQRSEGALFSDEPSSMPAEGKTDYSEKLTAVNTPENLAYFYQSNDIKIHITPNNPELGDTKTITIDKSKTAGRNKQFLLKIVPVKVSKRTVDFMLKVADWETDMIVVDMPFTDWGNTAGNEPEVLANGKYRIFAKGVNFESGWYDTNKSRGAGGFSDDSKMCWAIAQSNMTQWWQDRYRESGKTLPTGIPNGFVPGRENAEYRQLAIFEDYYVKKYGNVSGADMVGLPEYFVQYFPELFPNTEPFFLGRTYARSLAHKGHQDFSEFVVKAFRDENSVVYLAITGHGMTLWGCDYDPETLLVSAIHFTDSDDRYSGIWEAAPIRIVGNKLIIQNKDIESVTALSAYPGFKTNF